MPVPVSSRFGGDVNGYLWGYLELGASPLRVASKLQWRDSHTRRLLIRHVTPCVSGDKVNELA